jgi:hypothetical protein
MVKEAGSFHLLAELILPESTAVRCHLKESVYVDWQSCRSRQWQETEGASLDRSGHQPLLWYPQSAPRCDELGGLDTTSNSKRRTKYPECL